MIPPEVAVDGAQYAFIVDQRDMVGKTSLKYQDITRWQSMSAQRLTIFLGQQMIRVIPIAGKL